MGLFNKNKEEKNVPVAEQAKAETAKEEVKEEVKAEAKAEVKTEVKEAPKSAPVTKLDAAVEKELKLFAEKCDRIFQEVKKDIIGQTEVVQQTIIAIIAGGNVLLEGAPGLGKTRLVRSLGQVFDLPFSGIQERYKVSSSFDFKFSKHLLWDKCLHLLK